MHRYGYGPRLGRFENNFYLVCFNVFVCVILPHNKSQENLKDILAQKKQLFQEVNQENMSSTITKRAGGALVMLTTRSSELQCAGPRKGKERAEIHNNLLLTYHTCKAAVKIVVFLLSLLKK